MGVGLAGGGFVNEIVVLSVGSGRRYGELVGEVGDDGG